MKTELIRDALFVALKKQENTVVIGGIGRSSADLVQVVRDVLKERNVQNKERIDEPTGNTIFECNGFTWMVVTVGD